MFICFILCVKKINLATERLIANTMLKQNITKCICLGDFQQYTHFSPSFHMLYISNLVFLRAVFQAQVRNIKIKLSECDAPTFSSNQTFDDFLNKIQFGDEIKKISSPKNVQKKKLSYNLLFLILLSKRKSIYPLAQSMTNVPKSTSIKTKSFVLSFVLSLAALGLKI